MIYKINKFENFSNESISKILREDGRIFISILNGEMMTDEESFYKEFGVKLNFPDYYGKNYHALIDCLCDLRWIETDKIIIIIKNFNFVFKKFGNLQKQIIDELLLVLKEDVDDFWASDEDPNNYKDNPNLKVDFYLIEN